jgi:hypothetical protein
MQIGMIVVFIVKEQRVSIEFASGQAKQLLKLSS